MNRVYNFSAGPSMLPEELLLKAQAEMLDYNSTGMSVMEISHRSGLFQQILDSAEAGVRKVFDVSDEYAVLFLQGGGSTQFSMIPMNLAPNGKADYVDSGYWAHKALQEAEKYVDVRTVASTRDQNYVHLPKLDGLKFEGDYVYITSNNTIFGTQYKSFPKTGNVPMVVDMSSDIMSRKINVSDFGMIYAAAQKNIGPSGVVVVMIKKSLLRDVDKYVPTMLSYKVQADHGSMYNTPPTYGIYVAGLMFDWVLEQGGLDVIEKRNEEKAAYIYNFIDNSKFYTGFAAPEDRSSMNIVFKTPNADLDKKFTVEAGKVGLTTLGGHRATGGLRASMYNAMPMEGTKALVEFMKKFELNNK